MIEIIYTQINILPNNIITFKNIYSNHYKLIQQLINHLNIIFLLFMPYLITLILKKSLILKYRYIIYAKLQISL